MEEEKGRLYVVTIKGTALAKKVEKARAAATCVGEIVCLTR